jgi:hypothetical protein
MLRDELSRVKSSIGERGESVQTAKPAGETELEGTELALPMSTGIGRQLSSIDVKEDSENS